MNKLTLTLLLIFLCAGCKKEEEQGLPDGWSMKTFGPDLTFVHGVQPVPLQEFTLSGGVGVITTQSGIRLTIQDSSFTNAGTRVSNAGIRVLIREYFSNRDLITDKLQTVSKRVFINGGAFDISVSNPYVLKKPVAVSVPEVKGNFNAGFNVLPGAAAVGKGTGNFRNIYWAQAVPAIPWQQGVWGGSATCNFSIEKLGWYALGRFPVLSAPATHLTVRLPAGFGNVNARAYVFLPETGMEELDYDLAGFNIQSLDLPVGQSVRLLTVASKNERFYYDFRSFSVAENDTITITTLPETSVNALTTLIDQELD